jgi:hypothetical protein
LKRIILIILLLLPCGITAADLPSIELQKAHAQGYLWQNVGYILILSAAAGAVATLTNLSDIPTRNTGIPLVVVGFAFGFTSFKYGEKLLGIK